KAGLKITCYESTGGFTGDLIFNDCQFSGSAANRPLYLHAFTNSGNPKNEIRGLHFSDCVIYGTGTLLDSAGSNSLIADIWFTSCAWDGPNSPAGETAITINANLTANVFTIFFNNPYIVNYTGKAISLNNTGTGTMGSI